MILSRFNKTQPISNYSVKYRVNVMYVYGLNKNFTIYLYIFYYAIYTFEISQNAIFQPDNLYILSHIIKSLIQLTGNLLTFSD